MQKGKEMLREVRFLLFFWTGKRTPPIDCGKLCIHNVIPRAAIQTAAQKDMLKSTIEKSK